MKCYATLSLLCLLFSCYPKDDPPQAEGGFVTALKNGQMWTVPGETQFLGDTLIIWGLGREEVLSFLIQFDGEGVYELKGNHLSYYTTIGGDVLTSRYQLEENEVEELVIEKFDSKEGWLEGSFAFTLPQASPSSTDHPEAIDFEQGKFRLRVVAEE